MSKKTENKIQLYFHCKECLTKQRKDAIAVGWTEKGIQVWCDTCNSNVAAFDFRGQKIDYNNK